jgi:hypothetical protein
MPDLTHLTFGPRADTSDRRPSADVVEIPLLLSSHQATALLELSRQRHQSVGQILRDLISREINGPQANVAFPALGDFHTTCRDTSAC